MDERYKQWKSLVCVLYDWLANHNLVCPPLSCRASRDGGEGGEHRPHRVRGRRSVNLKGTGTGMGMGMEFRDGDGDGDGDGIPALAALRCHL